MPAWPNQAKAYRALCLCYSLLNRMAGLWSPYQLLWYKLIVTSVFDLKDINPAYRISINLFNEYNLYRNYNSFEINALFSQKNNSPLLCFKHCNNFKYITAQSIRNYLPSQNSSCPPQTSGRVDFQMKSIGHWWINQ